jgi:DNA polymerase I-like protein with 3'-5' exonuclease and polymerase domains
VKLPSGREFVFPNTQRKRDGTVTNFTAIKNYPVQGFATGDIVPAVLVEVHRKLSEAELKSCVVNSVHDSIVIDVHPAEKDRVKAIMDSINADLTRFVSTKFNVDINIPLCMEGSIGSTWLQQDDWV